MGKRERYRINTPHVAHDTIDGEVIAIHLADGSYYGLNRTASEIWNRIAARAALSEVNDELVERYRAERAEIERAVERLVVELEAEGLIVPDAGTDSVDSETGMGGEGAHEADKGAFVPPTLQKYTDMQGLILLDPIHDVDEMGWAEESAEPGDTA